MLAMRKLAASRLSFIFKTNEEYYFNTLQDLIEYFFPNMQEIRADRRLSAQDWISCYGWNHRNNYFLYFQLLLIKAYNNIKDSKQYLCY